jgi:hypothetical protein
MFWRVHAFRVRHTPTQARSQIEAIGSRDRLLRLSRAAPGYSIQEFSRGVKVASVAGCLLDHVQDHPAKIGDGLVCRVEVKFAEQSRVQVPRSQDLVRDHTLTAVLHEHRIAGMHAGEWRLGIVGWVLYSVVPGHLRLDPGYDPLEPHRFRAGQVPDQPDGRPARRQNRRIHLNFVQPLHDRQHGIALLVQKVLQPIALADRGITHAPNLGQRRPGRAAERRACTR